MDLQSYPPGPAGSKAAFADRLRAIRTEIYGAEGCSELAARLGLPTLTWCNYEDGVTLPAVVLLRFLEVTAAEPHWLLHGSGPKYRAVKGYDRVTT